jgi:hypothetical protein
VCWGGGLLLAVDELFFFLVRFYLFFLLFSPFHFFPLLSGDFGLGDVKGKEKRPVFLSR